jgi:hypothetical protein
MSHSQLHRNRWFQLVALGLILIGIFFLISPEPTITKPEVNPPPTPQLPAAVMAEQRGIIPASPQIISPALARAVATVGQVEDGRLADLSGLDEQAMAYVDYARVLLAGVPRRAAPGLPMRLPDGMTMKMGPDKLNEIPESPNPPVRDSHARIVDGHLIPRRLDISGRVPVPTIGDLHKELIEPDAWIAIPYDPALVTGQPLQIINRSGGLYAVSLHADDFSTVRLNGGLVVPGRFYQMDNTTVISGAIPVGVTIRPIGVLHGLYEQPIRPPQANG